MKIMRPTTWGLLGWILAAWIILTPLAGWLLSMWHG
jgi:hypothetical protein